MSYLVFPRVYSAVLLPVAMVIAFATTDQKGCMADSVVHSFYLPSVLKEGTDVQSREILFTTKYPGVVKIDASWEPAEKKLTITLYDQKGNSLLSKKGGSPVHFEYMYTQGHFSRAKLLGNSFKVEISQSPFRTINGSVTICTPEKKVIKKDESINIRGPYGTFIEEEKKEDNAK